LNAKKAAELVVKLTRVAAPGSGASENEKSSAALEVCRLITENNLTVSAPRTQEPRWWEKKQQPDVTVRYEAYAYSPPRYAAPREREDPFRSALAHEDSCCGEVSCGGQIFEGERVWRRVKNGAVEYVHADCWTSY